MKTTKLKNINWKHIIIIAITLATGIILGLVFSGSPVDKSESQHGKLSEQTEATVYTCSMHPQVRQDEPGQCPICAMDLVPVSTMETDQQTDASEIQMSESAMALASVQTMEVGAGVPVNMLHLQGKVKPDERNISEITARFGGRIEKLFVNYTGQEVRKGQELASIYSPELITAQKELIEAVKYKDTHPSLHNAARNKLRLWNLTEEQINAIENTRGPVTDFNILSPISGTVTIRRVAIGEYVEEGDMLFKVIDLTDVWVMFDVYESDLPWVSRGDKIDFTLPSIPGKEFSGKISYIDPFIDPSTRVAQARVEVENPDLALKPEMFVRGTLRASLEQMKEELLIPKSAVLWTGKRSVVYIKVPGRETPSFIYREIVLGPEAGEHYVVSSGLEKGEELAVNGVFKIDASAQLAGKPSMMNPEGGKMTGGHDHGSMDMQGQSKQKHMYDEQPSEHVMVKVYGNCGMCKTRIEDAANALEGVLSANWDKETQMLHLEFDPGKLKPEEIEKAIAAVGHDTENFRAPDEVYENLPACCLFKRPLLKK